MDRYAKRTSLMETRPVFQAEVHAIELCLRENSKSGYKGKTIPIYSDSQAALQTLASIKTKSKLVWNCLETLQALGNQNKVTLKRVPGHKGAERVMKRQTPLRGKAQKEHSSTPNRCVAYQNPR
ncbi:hypothetical protein NQ317_013149 [Molorchus minor]|uniref:RNase H type-1 domain-containing protein n=1 Tax=Molorchus minor TaxID=1323400 RepID=A0ABQ9IZR4_9CUCU|nr:hypothetical protein NQ317_013149 [Molorchus minor]